MTTDVQHSADNFWLFGYGSLIWKPPPHFEATFVDFGNEDHRGTPEDPGRVVTLIERSFWETLNDRQRDTEGDKVWGCAYHIVPSKVREVQEYLGIREINGYSIQYTSFHPANAQRSDIHCLVYIGMPDNPQFLGALEPGDVAQKINNSVGPSGENREYLLNLETALAQLSPFSHDEHISDLAKRVRKMNPPQRARGDIVAVGEFQHPAGDTEEQEEVEKNI